jgi:hypothetical protein
MVGYQEITSILLRRLRCLATAAIVGRCLE